jgi:hypothetical protein
VQSRFGEHFPTELLKGEDVGLHPAAAAVLRQIKSARRERR